MMRWHRVSATLAALLLAYVVLTGLGIQFADMRALVTHAPETDPDMLMMRQHINGPPNYAVVSAPDYTAHALPAAIDLAGGLVRAAVIAKTVAPGQPLRLVELRMAGTGIAAHIQTGERHRIFALMTGAPLPDSNLPPPQPDRNFAATRATFKFLHRFNYLGGIGPALNGLAAIALSILIVTGLVHYGRLYRARLRRNARSLWWKGSDGWRKLHRWTAITAGILVIWITATGLLLSLDNVGAFVHSTIHGVRDPKAFDGDQSSPLDAKVLPTMARTTLAAFHARMPGTAIKVVRLRIFASYPQGVVVADDPETTQFVFNAKTGAPMRMWEQGYPDLSFPSGWQVHQELKQLHRGDAFGMPGRWLDLLGGVALAYLILSGMVMYLQMWLRRRKAGRSALIWR